MPSVLAPTPKATQPQANIKMTQHSHPARQVVHTNGDLDTSNSIEARKFMGTYGLTPPAVEDFDTQMSR
ncbi:hypothetical protein LTR28_008671, partial [Elasticomyces elasticus]